MWELRDLRRNAALRRARWWSLSSSEIPMVRGVFRPRVESGFMGSDSAKN